MHKNEKSRRIRMALAETVAHERKTEMRYRESLKALKMEISENRAFGNASSANLWAVKHANDYKNRLRWYRKHRAMLEEMLVAEEGKVQCGAEKRSD